MKNIIKCLFLVSCIANSGVNAMEFTAKEKEEYETLKLFALANQPDPFYTVGFNQLYPDITQESVIQLTGTLGNVKEKAAVIQGCLDCKSYQGCSVCEFPISGNLAKVMNKVFKSKYN